MKFAGGPEAEGERDSQRQREGRRAKGRGREGRTEAEGEPEAEGGRENTRLATTRILATTTAETRLSWTQSTLAIPPG